MCVLLYAGTFFQVPVAVPYYLLKIQAWLSWLVLAPLWAGWPTWSRFGRFSFQSQLPHNRHKSSPSFPLLQQKSYLPASSALWLFAGRSVWVKKMCRHNPESGRFLKMPEQKGPRKQQRQYHRPVRYSRRLRQPLHLLRRARVCVWFLTNGLPGYNSHQSPFQNQAAGLAEIRKDPDRR